MKKNLLLASLLLPLLATAAHAAPPVPESLFLRSLAAPAACATALPTPTSEVLPPAPQKRTGGGCNAAFCTSNDDCPCDSGPGFCGSDSLCHYPPPGGGGGGLGCPEAFCFQDSQCLSNCPAGPNSYCGPGGTCVYVP